MMTSDHYDAFSQPKYERNRKNTSQQTQTFLRFKNPLDTTRPPVKCLSDLMKYSDTDAAG